MVLTRFVSECQQQKGKHRTSHEGEPETFIQQLLQEQNCASTFINRVKREVKLHLLVK